MIVSAHDVAREIRERQPDVGLAKLHKLLYYCQGWALFLNGEPLFSEGIEAWTNGPVVANLWHDENKQRERPKPQQLKDDQVAVVDEVMGRYGQYSGARLIDMTHREGPWVNAITSDVPNPPIRHRALLAHFASVTGMEQAQRRQAGDAPAKAAPSDPLTTAGELEALSPDQRAAVVRGSIVTNLEDLPPDHRAEVAADARRLSAGFTSRS